MRNCTYRKAEVLAESGDAPLNKISNRILFKTFMTALPCDGYLLNTFKKCWHFVVLYGFRLIPVTVLSNNIISGSFKHGFARSFMQHNAMLIFNVLLSL